MYELIIFLLSIIAALVTQHISIDWKQGPVIASASVSLVFGVTFFFLPAEMFGYNIELIVKSAPVAVMGASFAAMSSGEMIPTKKLMVIAGAVFSLVFLFASPLFQGLGGGLGTTACVSVIMTLGMVKIHKFLSSKIY